MCRVCCCCLNLRRLQSLLYQLQVRISQLRTPRKHGEADDILIQDDDGDALSEESSQTEAPAKMRSE